MAPKHSLNDEELVILAQQGDIDAFNCIYDRYLPIVFNRVRYNVPETDVEDVTQEIFIAVMRSLRNFRGEARFSTWLRTIIKRQVADYYRRRTPADDALDLENDDPDDDSDPLARHGIVETLKNLDDTILLRQALQKLPGNYQEILLLRFADGLQFNEIGPVMSLSLEATKSLFRRAVTALQKFLED